MKNEPTTIALAAKTAAAAACVWYDMVCFGEFVIITLDFFFFFFFIIIRIHTVFVDMIHKFDVTKSK